MSAPPLSVFISYAHKDEDLKNELRTHLRAMERSGRISVWDDRAINAGANWEQAILDRLAGADLLLMLISPSFIASDYCFGEEMTRAVARHLAGEAVLVPILMRPSDWQDDLPFIVENRIQAVPRDNKPVTGTNDWPSRDVALLEVVKELRKLVNDRQGSAAAPQPEAARASLAPARPEIPRLLADLCDRSEQDTLFDIALRANLQGAARRPFVFLLHGHDAERHLGFRERLAQVRIPRLLNLDKAQTSVECLGLDNPSTAMFRDPRDAFRAELGNQLMEDRSATLARLAEYVNGHAPPLLLTSLFDESRDPPERLRKLIATMLAFWADWPDLPPDRALLHCIAIRYDRVADAAAEAAREDLRKFLRRLAGREGGFKDHPRVAGAVLPELASVAQSDVLRWTELREVRRFSRIEPEDVAALYERQPRRRPDGTIPMEPLHKDMHQLAVIRQI